MIRSVYNFDHDRLNKDVMESGYSVAKSLNQLYEKHGSVAVKRNSHAPIRIMTPIQIIKQSELNHKSFKTNSQNDVMLTNKQMELIEMLVRQKASILLMALNETATMNFRKQINEMYENPAATEAAKKSTKKRMMTHSKTENKKLAIGLSPLMCKSTSSIDFSASKNVYDVNIEPIREKTKPRRRSSTERGRANSLEKKENKTKSKEYTTRYGRAKNRKHVRKLTIMMKISEESENEPEEIIESNENDEIIKNEEINQTSETSITPTSSQPTFSLNSAISSESTCGIVKDSLSEISLSEISLNGMSAISCSEISCSEISCSEISCNEASCSKNLSSESSNLCFRDYKTVADLDCYKDYKKILLSLAQKGPKKSSS